MIKRGVKTPQEILRIKRACELGDKVHSQILKKIKIGVTEKEVARNIVQLIKQSKGRLSFRPIVAFGKNASEVHHKPTNLKLGRKHGFIMIDMGVKLNGYCSDMTRTLFFGKASKRQKRIYKTVLNAQKIAIDFISNHSNDTYYRSAKEADRIARDYIAKKGFPPFPHTLGHGIGKRVHEGFRLGPKSKTIFKNGMVFTIEPGIYIKGYGGVRIEDTFYLNKGKLIQLTKSPKTLLEL